MNWLLLSYFLTFGNVNGSYAIQNQDYNYYAISSSALSSTLGMELVAIDHIFVSAEVKTDEQIINFHSFSPFLSEYTVKVGLRWGGIEAGYVDNCIHPTLDSNVSRNVFFYGGYSGFYVKFSGSAKLF